LKDLIYGAGMTYDDLASKLGTNKAQISAWNTGKNTPRLDSAARLARELGVSLHSLTRSLGIDVEGIPLDYRSEDPWTS
jgi:transcriptional regulator with XRE-family HTH domain